ncbi:NAD(P)-dependent oxidoreductase [Paenibacillus sp. YIM B09110]|uniref:NAD(P)-dependent oxidoreductase n=1 Tax=Paenibacillus sp. YIM B09110 TaxID=3126102 RepID=UPI00301C1A3B
MNIIIFGANGKTGRELMERALKQGHSVTAFVRDPSKILLKDANLNIVKGEATNYSDVEKVLKANKYDIAYSVLGAKGMFKRDLPLIGAMQNIVKAMEKNNVPKLIHVSFIGAREEAVKLGFVYKYIIPNFMKNLLLDHREKDTLLTNSRLTWTLVQPPSLTSGPYTGRYMHEAQINMGVSRKLKLSRADLADFMIKQLNDDTYNNKAVFVTE